MVVPFVISTDDVGMNASLWAFVPNWAVFWFSYEALKRRLVPPFDAENTSGPQISAAAHVASAFGAGALRCFRGL